MVVHSGLDFHFPGVYYWPLTCLLRSVSLGLFPSLKLLGAQVNDLPVIPALTRYRPGVPGAVWLSQLAGSVLGSRREPTSINSDQGRYPTAIFGLYIILLPHNL